MNNPDERDHDEFMRLADAQQAKKPSAKMSSKASNICRELLKQFLASENNKTLDNRVKSDEGQLSVAQSIIAEAKRVSPHESDDFYRLGQMQESTLGGWINKLRCTTGLTATQKTGPEPILTPAALSYVDKHIHRLRMNCRAVDVKVVRNIILKALQDHRPNFLKITNPIGGVGVICDSFCRNVLKGLNYRRRAKTGDRSISDKDIVATTVPFHDRLRSHTNSRDPRLILNMDEFFVRFEPDCKYTWVRAQRGEKINIKSCKAGFSASILTNAAGETLLLQVIFQGKTKHSLVRIKKQDVLNVEEARAFDYVIQHFRPDSHFQNADTFQAWAHRLVDKVIPKLKDNRCWTGDPAHQRPLLIVDSATQHSKATVDFLAKNGVDIEIIPPSTTHINQPADQAILSVLRSKSVHHHQEERFQELAGVKGLNLEDDPESNAELTEELFGDLILDTHRSSIKVRKFYAVLALSLATSQLSSEVVAFSWWRSGILWAMKDIIEWENNPVSYQLNAIVDRKHRYTSLYDETSPTTNFHDCKNNLAASHCDDVFEDGDDDRVAQMFPGESLYEIDSFTQEEALTFDEAFTSAVVNREVKHQDQCEVRIQKLERGLRIRRQKAADGDDDDLLLSADSAPAKKPPKPQAKPKKSDDEKLLAKARIEVAKCMRAARYIGKDGNGDIFMKDNVSITQQVRDDADRALESFKKGGYNRSALSKVVKNIVEGTPLPKSDLLQSIDNIIHSDDDENEEEAENNNTDDNNNTASQAEPLLLVQQTPASKSTGSHGGSREGAGRKTNAESFASPLHVAASKKKNKVATSSNDQKKFQQPGIADFFAKKKTLPHRRERETNDVDDFEDVSLRVDVEEEPFDETNQKYVEVLDELADVANWGDSRSCQEFVFLSDMFFQRSSVSARLDRGIATALRSKDLGMLNGIVKPAGFVNRAMVSASIAMVRQVFHHLHLVPFAPESPGRYCLVGPEFATCAFHENIPDLKHIFDVAQRGGNVGGDDEQQGGGNIGDDDEQLLRDPPVLAGVLYETYGGGAGHFLCFRWVHKETRLEIYESLDCREKNSAMEQKELNNVYPRCRAFANSLKTLFELPQLDLFISFAGDSGIQFPPQGKNDCYFSSINRLINMMSAEDNRLDPLKPLFAGYGSRKRFSVWRKSMDDHTNRIENDDPTDKSSMSQMLKVFLPKIFFKD